ncbi:MAG: YidC/Oxa1 family membrane protein insertase [bacterium]|nr:YidC/Oxa1 family membrane protein insertase [bacterium]
MEFLLLTKDAGTILGPVAEILGIIMNAIFQFTSMFGFANIGICIILFTLIVKLLMFPLTIKQQKSSKIMAIVNPEVQLIQKKYKGKKDQDSMMKQNAEIQAVYEKYGYSATAGCLPLLIQLPILLALYRVIYNIPAYVASVKDLFMQVVTPVQASLATNTELGTQLTELASTLRVVKFDLADPNKLVDLFYKFTPEHWNSIQAVVPDISSQVVDQIEHMNSFLGANLAVAPGWTPSLLWIIPILAGLSQWYSTRMITKAQGTSTQNDPDNPMAQSMKSMNTVMPLMSAFFCISFPTGIGIYWIASSVLQIIQQWIVNIYMDRVDVDEMIAKNVEKMNKKRAKKGLPPTRVNSVSSNIKDLYKQEEERQAKLREKMQKAEESAKEATAYYNADAKAGSLASKAAMVQKFNEKNSREKNSKK